MINKQELKYIAYSGIFAIAWFMFLLPYFVKKFDGNSPAFQFFIFSIGLYIFFFIFLKSTTTSISFNLKTSLGLLALFLAMDIYMPEYHVQMSGELLPGANLGVSAPDYFIGFLATQVGLSGFLVYLATYILIPIVLLFVSSKLLPNFVRNI